MKSKYNSNSWSVSSGNYSLTALTQQSEADLGLHSKRAPLSKYLLELGDTITVMNVVG